MFIFRYTDGVELSLCLLLNRLCERRRIERLLAAVSRLGNGMFWYTLMAVVPLVLGRQALQASVHMALIGAAGVIVHKLLKSTMVRERPFVAHHAIHRGTVPLDLCSFPSGHTLHAVAFSIVAVSYYPTLIWVVGPFSAMVALSRVVLGLRYPTDVVAGGAIGVALAYASFLL
ncbi:MAG: phosphatase PAP2 family protein [Gammaproteobacteria bacterium]|nr:phosphatase PAP2 family protein [Gammaproteobacteria bacterium]NIR97327.1 phosphatase PAP2 family protein [Gammaproteobacteria bacterium]NIT63370.1 phosphatase PAP2 family protein [Gammaproteobacteria bacterium]NIV20297.1 phosphatase PAP2 family protein [Gammaproteobacteria bacterium]NIX10714.1 phosphatase PAP2 family protein [Gammaproteobacteria bacterium]